MLREEAMDMELGAQRYDSFTRKASTAKSFHMSRGSAWTRRPPCTCG